MTRKSEEAAHNRITKLKIEIDRYLDRSGPEKLMEILMAKFALSENQASNLLILIAEMIPGVSYRAIPKDWFFKVRVKQRGNAYYVIGKDDSKPGGKRKCKTLKELNKDIREERDEIRNTIQLTWKLSDEKRISAIDRWPEEYQDYLNKKPITLPDEVKVLSAVEVANIVTSKRYNTKPSTIETYAKLGSSKTT